MRRIRLTESNLRKAVDAAAAVLRNSGVILYPTDTLYGLGVDALSDEAVGKVIAIKGRKEWKPIHAIVSDLEMAARYGEIPDAVRILVRRLPKGQVTFIVEKKNFDTGIGKGIDTFGFRIPDNEFCVALCKKFGGPITATSANLSGQESRRTIENILSQFKYTHIPKYVGMLNLVIDAGELPEAKPSTVIDLSRYDPVRPDSVRVLRAGAVSAVEILNALRA